MTLPSIPPKGYPSPRSHLGLNAPSQALNSAVTLLYLTNLPTSFTVFKFP